MIVTFLVSKLDKSKVVKLLQLLNISSILVTLDVLKLDKSKEYNPQPSNILPIIVTLLVLKLDKSKVVKLLQA